MRRAGTCWLLATLAIAVGCGTPAPTPAPDPARPPPGPPLDPLPGWRAHLRDRIGGEQKGPTLNGDFNGDGSIDAAAVVGDTFLIFHDRRGAKPSGWEVVQVDPQAPGPRVEPIASYPAAAALSPGKHAIVFGDDAAPLVVFFHGEARQYAWIQPVPAALEPALTDAARRVKLPAALGSGHFFGDRGYEGKAGTLVDAFAGDFDADGQLELAVVSAPDQIIFHYAPGAATPTRQTLDYPAGSGIVHKNDRTTVHPFPADDAETPDDQASLELRGDFLELAIPESSSVYLTRHGQWQTIFISD